MNRCFSLLSILLLVSCSGNRQVRAILNQAESCMSASPDSSLALVNGIDGESLPTRKLRALHALLKTMAQDKCYIDVARDSTIRVAYDYYQRHGGQKERLLSSYYLGVIWQNEGDLINAAIMFREAEPLAEELKDYRQLSLIQQHLSSIYRENYDHVRALEYAEKALNAAEKAEEELMADYCRYDMARQLVAEYRYEDAEPLLSQVLRANKGNASLYSLAAKRMAEVMLFKNNPDWLKAKDYYREVERISSKDLLSHDYGVLALISEKEKDSNKAEHYLQIAESMLVSSVDSAVYYNDCRNVYANRGDWERAHTAKTKSTKIQDRITIQLLEQSISHAMENYYEDKWSLEKMRSRSRLYLFFLISLVALISISLLYILMRKRNQQLLDDLASTQNVSSELLHTLVSDKIKSLQQLSESFFSWEDSSLAKLERKKGRLTKDEVIASFRTQLSELRNDHAFISSLEQSLNLSEDGIMDKARQMLKNEKELDFSILTLLFSGFSIKSISYLLRMSEASLRMRKTRFKQQSESISEPERTLFLEKLG